MSGPDNNDAGAVAALEYIKMPCSVARLLSECTDSLRRGTSLVFWSGHSHGRYAGSTWYADNHWQNLHDHCVCHVNSDCTGGVGASIVTEPPVMPLTKLLASDIVCKVTGQDLEFKRIGRYGDQSFYGIGLPSLFATFTAQDIAETAGDIAFATGGRRSGGLGWWWHTPYDTVDKVSGENLTRDTRVYLAAVFRLCTASVLPFDYRETVADLLDTVEQLQVGASDKFDFAVLLTTLEELRDRIGELYTWYSKTTETGLTETQAETMSQLFKCLARYLIPVNFHAKGHYDHDSFAPLQPLPSLADAACLGELDQDDSRAYLLRAPGSPVQLGSLPGERGIAQSDSGTGDTLGID